MADYASQYRVLIKTEIYESLDSLDNPIGYVYPTDEIHLDLIQPNVGKYYQFSKVVLNDSMPVQPESTSLQPGLKTSYRGKELYVRSCFLAPVDGSGLIDQSKLPFEVVGEYEQEPVPNPIKIKDAELDLPYSEGNCINIVMDTGFVNPLDLVNPAKMKELKEMAITKMVEYYGRSSQSSTQIEEFAVNPFDLIEVSEPYFPVRPGKGIHLKFCIKNHYFDAFPSRTFEEYTVENIHKNYIAVNIRGSELEDIINQIVKVLEKYDSDLSKFRGSVTGINFKKLSTELRSFLSKFKKLLSANKISLESVGESKFEIGFHAPNEAAADDCDKKGTYKLEYILLFNPYGQFLSIGLSNLTKSVSTALAKLIIAHKDILSASLGGMGWQDLLEKYFGGEFKISFSTPATKNSSLKKPKSELESEVKNATADHADLSIMDADKNLDLSNVKKDPKFKQSASELLVKSRDVVGDNFLINLPEILANVDDLTSLYGLVFDKVSIKDLTDLLMEKMTENLNLPDVNEIKLRGILKSLNIDISLDLMLQFIQTEYEMKQFMLAVCDVYEFKKEEIDRVLGLITTPGFPVEFYFFHYKDTTGTAPELGGFLPSLYSGMDTFALIEKLKEHGILSQSDQACDGALRHVQAFKDGNFQISNFFQADTINKIMCQIFTDGLGTPDQGSMVSERLCPSYAHNFNLPGTSGGTIPFDLPHFKFTDLKEDIFEILLTLDKNIIAKAIDIYIKGLFKTSKDYQLDTTLKSNMPTGQYAAGATSGIPTPPPTEFQHTPGELFDRFTGIPKISIELDKLSLTKKKMLNKAPNVDIDLEMKKKDVNFTLPSIKSVNPSFDFTSFEFTAMGDIFGTAVGAIEDAIVDGIEKGLVTAFKGILNNVLDSLNMDMPDIGAPDFGGLDMNDLLDASSGVSADAIANLVLDDLKFDISKNPLFDPCADPDLSDFIPSAEDIKNIFSQMSAALKPMELTRIMKGQKNKKDYDNMLPAITDEKMKIALTPMAFDRIMDVVADFADTAMLEELEASYDNKEVMVSICKDNGIPYCLGEIKDTLKEKYSTLSEPELCDLIDGIVEETKDSLVDAIGNMKENFKDSLPFSEDPCTFMPKPNDIPAMNFVNDLAFDTVFTPIKLEYKQEASTFPDMMMQTKEKEEYVKLRYERYDSIVRDTVVDPDYGIFKIEYEFVFQAEPSIDFGDLTGDGGLYNQEFGNHYYGSQTPIYYKDSAGNFRKAKKSRYEIEQQGDESYEFTGDYQNLYVKKLEESLQPLPELKNALIENKYQVLGYSSDHGSGLTMPTIIAVADGVPRVLKLQNGIRIAFPGLKTAEASYSFPEESLDEAAEGLIVYETVFAQMFDPQSPIIYHDFNAVTGTVSMAFPKVNSLNNPECVIMDTEPTVVNDTYGMGYADGISDSLEYMMEKKMDKYLPTGHPSYRDYTNFYMDGYDVFFQKNEGQRLDQKDLVTALTAQTAQLYMKSYASSELFDTNEMLSFIFDTDEINLFDVEAAKNSAKDEYNEQCDFSDSDVSKMRLTTIKKLIYLTVRIYVIDVLMLSCFINSVAYDEEINDYLKQFIFDYMKAQLSAEKDSYYSVFKDFYSQTYGQEIETENSDGTFSYSDSFDKLITEIYSDVAKYFGDIFPMASSHTTDAFIENSNVFFGDESDFVTEMYDIFMASLADSKNNNRFVLKLVYTDEFTKEESLYTGTQPLIFGTLTLRLCYIADFTEIQNAYFNNDPDEGTRLDTERLAPLMQELGITATESKQETIVSSLNKYPINYRRLDFSDEAENSISEQIEEQAEAGFESISFLGTIRAQKFTDTVSFNYIYELGSAEAFHPHLVCIPLAESGINGRPFTPGRHPYAGWEDKFSELVEWSEGYRTSLSDDNSSSYLRKSSNLFETAIKKIARERDEEYGIQDFVLNRLRSESYFDLLRRCMISKMQQIKPETALIFQDTKASIRRAILTISQEKDNFDYIDQDAAQINDIQAAGVGTNPDFSPKAKKMALMTVPLIIKGMAEMFDPNTKLASLIRKGANLSGVNISPPVASLMALPFNIIPLAPGPPITPLGLTYLATSFLEPKERKQLSDIKRGKNRNPKTDPLTGGLEIGTPQEQLAERNEIAEESVQRSLRVHMAISQLCRDFADGMQTLANLHSNMLDWDDDTQQSEALNNVHLPSSHTHAEGIWGNKYASTSELPLDYTPVLPTAYTDAGLDVKLDSLDFTEIMYYPIVAGSITPSIAKDSSSLPGRLRALNKAFEGDLPSYDGNYDPIAEGANLQRFFQQLVRLASHDMFGSGRARSLYRFNRTLQMYVATLHNDTNLDFTRLINNQNYRYDDDASTAALNGILRTMDRMYYVAIRSVALFGYLLADFLILEEQFFSFNADDGTRVSSADLAKLDHTFPESTEGISGTHPEPSFSTTISDIAASYSQFGSTFTGGEFGAANGYRYTASRRYYDKYSKYVPTYDEYFSAEDDSRERQASQCRLRSRVRVESMEYERISPGVSVNPGLKNIFMLIEKIYDQFGDPDAVDTDGNPANPPSRFFDEMVQRILDDYIE